MDDQEILHNQLERLNEEHRELDVMIEKMLGENIVNQIAVQRLKKRKLLLKDQMLKLKSRLLPDIIA
ncbi:hypothetical protein Cva_00948 [Caedimonas varicaedens]|uniref:DUF465 domain-containing protein n=1 Tax=Caedimonas varicaedens TaxID=1629334 RepID=A0A0K8MEJ3_9PROT|nr:hypothetical protein Cva_00948 [Caedimonas varicaedens]